MDPTLLFTILSALGVATTTLLLVRAQRRQINAQAAGSEADASGSLVATALSLVDKQQERLNRLEVEMKSLTSEVHQVRRENDVLRTWAKLLVAQIVEIGQDPVPLVDAERAVLKQEHRWQPFA